MKRITVFALLFCCAFASVCHASYYENWFLEAEILEVYEKGKTREMLAKNRAIGTGKTFIGMKVRIRKCVFKEGHGKDRCKKDTDIVIVLNYDPKSSNGKFAKDMVLKIRYNYSNGAVPAGQVAESHYWSLVTVKNGENAKPKK